MVAKRFITLLTAIFTIKEIANAYFHRVLIVSGDSLVKIPLSFLYVFAELPFFFSNASELVTTCCNRINLRETLLTILGSLFYCRLN